MKRDDGEPILIRNGDRIDVNELFLSCTADPKRVLADDEISTVIYVGDMGVHAVSGIGHPVTGEPPSDVRGHWGDVVREISVLRFPPASVRRQIGSAVKSILEDDIFIVRDAGGAIRKVRGRDLEAGMVLRSGEKIFL